jgi:hypothetical protein
LYVSLIPALEHLEPGIATALALGRALTTKVAANRMETPMRFIKGL